MLEAYKMIYVNILSLGVVAGFLLAYRFIFPKRKFPYFYALLLLSIPPIISIFRYGTYESGDLSLHTKFSIDFFQNLKEGNLIPQWFKHNNLSYGSTNFLYMYPLPYYLISLIHILGFSFIASIKAYLICTYILSGIFMYLWIKNEISERAGFMAAIFYLYAPYHLVDMHFRVTIAEMASFMLLPLGFYLIRKIFYSTQIRFFILLSLTISFLILSHQAIITISLPLFLLYIIICSRRIKKKRVLVALLAIGFGFLNTAYYWVPILLEKQYIFFDSNTHVLFPQFYEYIFTKWKLGFLFQGPEGELSFIIGYVQILILLYSIYLYKKGGFGKHSLLYLSFISATLVIFLFMQSFSKELWKVIPLVSNFQFSYRLMVIISLLTSAVAGIVSTRIINQKLYFLIIFLAIFPTILNWGNRRVIPEIKDEYLRKELLNGDPGLGDITSPRWVNFNKLEYYPLRSEGLTVLNGNATFRRIDNKVIHHTYVINAKDSVTLRENTFYYPTWSVLIDKRTVPINLDFKRSEGTLVFNAPKGIHLIEVIFMNSTTRDFFLKISIFSWTLTLSLPFFFLKSRKNIGNIINHIHFLR